MPKERTDGAVHVECEILAEYERSIQVRVPDGKQGRLVFVPHSALQQIHRQDGYIVIDAWLARKENLL